jgi:glycosyltransferase involved in cell wall biosynthesis
MKDHKTFISAMAVVAQQVASSIFVLVGRGVDSDNSQLAGWLDEAGIGPERVRLLGERADIERIMAAMDVHVSSSIGESFPNVVGESMACGVPNVVTDVGDSAVIVGETGEVVAPGDSITLGNAICLLLHKRLDNMAEMENITRNRVVERFSLPRVVALFANLYEDLCIDEL